MGIKEKMNPPAPRARYSKLRRAIKKIPEQPGVYLFWSKEGQLLYVGKASNLRRRVSSYFHGKTPLAVRSGLMVSNIRDLDYIPTATSAEALIYEAALIKEKKPKYNVELKDDKSYPYLELTAGERFPRLFITRKRDNPKSIYYGPYTSVKLLREACSMMKSVFPLRTCKKIPKKPCLSYSLGECLGPCKGVSEKEYKRAMSDLKLFLSADKPKLLKILSERMLSYSGQKRFEEALRVRNAIEALSVVIGQKKAPTPLKKDLEALKKVLNLKIIPARIEAFDISDIHGKEAVGSMVSFFNGSPQKDEYRRFKIKDVRDIDDYTMMREVIRRRYTRALREKTPLPDLILVDGGKGHLNVARDELNKIGLMLPVISIAKEKEIIYTEKNKEPLELSRRSSVLKLVMKVRDEAHRFAISYHHLLRGKTAFISHLNNIKGIGYIRKRLLIEHFGSVEEIKKKTPSKLMEVKGIGEKRAEEIVAYFRKK